MKQDLLAVAGQVLWWVGVYGLLLTLWLAILR